MLRELELSEKLEILMSLAAEDREGPPETSRPLPPRLRHAAEPESRVESPRGGCAPAVSSAREVRLSHVAFVSNPAQRRAALRG